MRSVPPPGVMEMASKSRWKGSWGYELNELPKQNLNHLSRYISDCLGGLYGSSPCQSIPHYQYSWCGLKSEESEFNHGLILPGGVTWNYGDKGFQVDAMMSRKWCQMGSHEMRWRSSRSYGLVLAQIGPAGYEICSKHLQWGALHLGPLLNVSRWMPCPGNLKRTCIPPTSHHFRKNCIWGSGKSWVFRGDFWSQKEWQQICSLHPSLRHCLTLVALAKQTCFSSQPIHCHIGPYLYFSGSLACLVHPAMSKTLSDILGLLETGLLASWRVYPNFDNYGIAEPWNSGAPYFQTKTWIIAAGGGPKLLLDLPWHLGPTTHRRVQGHLYLDLQLLFSKCPRSHLPKLRRGIFH